MQSNENLPSSLSNSTDEHEVKRGRITWIVMIHLKFHVSEKVGDGKDDKFSWTVQ